jgi:preprotein translocase subunit YajC
MPPRSSTPNLGDVEVKNFSMIYVVIALIAAFYFLIMWILASDNNARKELLEKDSRKNK